VREASATLEGDVNNDDARIVRVPVVRRLRSSRIIFRRTRSDAPVGSRLAHPLPSPRGMFALWHSLRDSSKTV